MTFEQLAAFASALHAQLTDFRSQLVEVDKILSDARGTVITNPVYSRSRSIEAQSKAVNMALTLDRHSIPLLDEIIADLGSKRIEDFPKRMNRTPVGGPAKAGA